MTQDLPLWFTIWRSVDALLAIALNAALVLPLMLAACLALGRARHREAMADMGSLCLTLGMGASLFGLLDLVARALVDLRFLPAAMPSLTPLPFAPLSGPWLASTTTICLWVAGMSLLWAAAVQAMRAWSDTGDKAPSPRRRDIVAAIVALLAFACLFVSVITRNWPFLGLPDGMTEEKVFFILLNHAWRVSCGALMPAGALVLLAFFLRMPGMGAEETHRARQARAADATGCVDPFRLEGAPAVSLRMGAAFAIAGAVFQFLDASFLALGYGTGGTGPGGPMGFLLKYGPFLVTALCLACWTYLFAKPRRTGLFLALFPAMLLILRAVARF